MVAGQPVADRWRLRKAKTLVKLLALAPGHGLHRDVVVEILWPDAEPRAAANNLHQVVHGVRRMMGPGSIAFMADVVRLGPDGEVSVDVDLFEAAAVRARTDGDITALQEALGLWTGPLLPEDLYADWASEPRDRLNEIHAAVATLLGSKLSGQGHHEAALAVLEPLGSGRPLDEQLHRVLIEALAACGRKWEAIEAYERLRDALDDAYAAEPESATKDLYRRLLTGQAVRRAQEPGAQAGPAPAPRALVGRRAEWERLRSSWQQASMGKSHLLLITGEAGVGKTRLAEQLLALADQQGMATARARCYGAEGRLTLAPVTEWLRSAQIRESLAELDEVWLTETARLVPELLVERPRLPRPQPLTELGQRPRFFEALARAVLAVPQPLLLLIDDLQWCDAETLRWLHFLLRFGPPKRLLIIGTARREELVPAHSVARWLLGLRSEGDVIELELESLGRDETAQLAAQVIKRDLDDRSAAQLYRETEGNPLFVVEMATAGLGKQARRRWSAGRDLSAPRFAAADLPPRMHAVIAGRLAQLSPTALELAGLAAVAGRAFSSEILRQASGSDPDSLTEAMDELWHRRIVRVAPQQSAPSPVSSTSRVPGPGANSFDFSHDKIRDVAYAELSPMKQRYWHSRVAQAMVTVHAADLDPVAAQVAAHYERAGEAARAIPFYQRAAEVAQRLYAHEESIALIKRGLALLDQVPDLAEREQQEVDLLRLSSLALVATRGYGAREVLDTLSRVQRLDVRLGKPDDPPLLRALAIASLNHRNFSEGHAFGQQLLQLANRQDDEILLVEAHYVLGVALFWTGSFTRSRTHLEHALAHYDPAHSPTHIARYSQDPKVICQCRLAFTLWCLGYPEQATAAQSEGVAQARAIAHPFSLAYALTWDAMLHGARRDFNSLLHSTGAVLELTRQHPLGLWSSWARALRGWALAERGQPELGIAELQRGDEQMRATGSVFLQPFVASLIAEQFARMGQVERGLGLLDEVLAGGSDNRQSWCDAELHRLRGNLLAAQSIDTREAEAAYRRAIEIAQAQQAKLFELRAATDLAQRWLMQGRRAPSREVLTGAYGWFTEGLDTFDLKKARSLLDVLGATTAE